MTSRLQTVLRALVPGTGSILEHVCPTAVELLSVDGAGLAVMNNQHASFLCAFGPSAQQGEDLQVTLGEGPCRDALTQAVFVEEADLESSGSARWPIFGIEILQIGVRSIASFPLLLGTARLGALTTYRLHAGELSEDQLANGFVLAQIATYLVIGTQSETKAEQLLAELEDGFVHLAPMHQATGMVMAQLGNRGFRGSGQSAGPSVQFGHAGARFRRRSDSQAPDPFWGVTANGRTRLEFELLPLTGVWEGNLMDGRASRA